MGETLDYGLKGDWDVLQLINEGFIQTCPEKIHGGFHVKYMYHLDSFKSTFYGRTMYFSKCLGIAPRSFLSVNHLRENNLSAYL